jgi:lipid-binding SYLF domain-containing protein
MILGFNSAEALKKVTCGTQEWEVGADASVAVAKVGAGGALDTTSLKSDVASFIFGGKGLMCPWRARASTDRRLDPGADHRSTELGGTP